MAKFPANSGNPSAKTTSQDPKKFFVEIQALIEKGKIPEAEKLREQLIAVHPMALTEIIQAAELIDQAKSARIDKNHLAIWDTLYASLSVEERNCLYYSLKKVVVPPGKVILAHGAFNTRLFFIDSGQVTIYLPKGDKHQVIAQLGRGDILGEYTFATISLCSATAVSHSEVTLMCLESTAADGWEVDQPGLYDKLIDFCIHYGRVDEIIRRKDQEKRDLFRYSVEGRVLATLLTKDQEKTETSFRGSLSDISAAGTCFAIKCSKKATARALLARHLALSFTFERGNETITLDAVGKVVGICFHLYNDYSVHVQFLKRIPEEQLRKAAAGTTANRPLNGK